MSNAQEEWKKKWNIKYKITTNLRVVLDIEWPLVVSMQYEQVYSKGS